MPASDRAGYASRQAQLLDALLRGDGYPEGFVVAQADAAGRSLRRKRASAVADAWPALTLALGDTFDARFDAYARAIDAPASGLALEDGLAFARSLEGGLRRGDDARAELMLARAALRRRGLSLRAGWLRDPQRRLLVVARLPYVGPLHWAVRWRCSRLRAR